MISFLLNNFYLIALQAGLFFGFFMIVRTFWFTFWRQSKDPQQFPQSQLYYPQQYQGEKLQAQLQKLGPPVPRPGEFPPDLAWPLYTLRQSAIDKKAVRGNLYAYQKRVWTWPVNTFFKKRYGKHRWPWWFPLTPVPITVLFFLGGAFLVSWASYWVYWGTLTAFWWIDKTMIVALRGQMRVREARRREAMHTAAACTKCLHVTPWPAYACPNNCGQLHHDVMPGDLGTFYRKCQCGAKFPTLPSRAAWHTPAVCKRQECQQQLPDGAGAVRDIRVPVFGAVAAGKTSFLYASLISLQLDLDRSHIKWDYLDDSSRMEAESRIKEIRDGQSAIQKTGPGPAISVNLKLRDGAHADFIHLFDASGEQYSNPGNWDLVYGNQPTNYGSLRFLEDGQALAYVLDPFSVDLIRDQAAAHDQAVVARAQPAQMDPEVSYTEVLNRLRGFGVPVDAQRLAVVVSKADLLSDAGLAVPTDSDDIARWLADNGVHNLVMAAAREFREVRYFAVASVDVSASRAHDPGIPLRWLLAAHGVKVPGGDALLAKSARRPVGASS
ncbi:MAG TPA: hypothetical protein VI365_37525 [Trebonia sp.]